MAAGGLDGGLIAAGGSSSGGNTGASELELLRKKLKVAIRTWRTVQLKAGSVTCILYGVGDAKGAGR